MKLLWSLAIVAVGACSQPSGQSASRQSADGSADGGGAPIAAPYATQTAETNNARTALPSAPKESACRVQDNAVLSNQPLKVVGTEPFWGARIDGRCVTYSTPENQAGTRIWTRFTPSAEGGTWVGVFENKPFELTTKAVKSCSDGMSDTIYPIEAELKVSGEALRGCAAPV